MHPLRYIPLMMAVLLTAACSSDTTVTEVKVVDTRIPMVFGTSSASASTETEVTRVPLEGTHQSFKVGTWKAFGTDAQQNVMDGYKVQGSAASGGGTYKWDYEGIVAGGQTQVLRYWDLSAFPYEFRAIAPYDDNTSITTGGIAINCTATNYFQSQKYEKNSDTPTSGKEPYVVAHVSRAKDGSNYVDRDIIKKTDLSSTGEATREVHLPFHHLMTKIGFRVFIDNPAPDQKSYNVILESMIISIHGKDGKFITASKTYNASNTEGFKRGVFSDNIVETTSKSSPYVLLEHGQYYEPLSSTTLLDLHKHLHRENAYNLTPGELLQIPQSDVEIKVEVKIKTNFNEETGQLYGDGTAHEETYSRWLNIMHDEDEHEPSHFTWLPDNRYIYYLRIGNIHEHDIFLDTCEILPWDKVGTTTIDVGL